MMRIVPRNPIHHWGSQRSSTIAIAAAAPVSEITRRKLLADACRGGSAAILRMLRDPVPSASSSMRARGAVMIAASPAA